MSDSSSATVFISNMSRDHDYTKAATYGAIRPITSGNYPIFKTTRLVDEVINTLIHSKESDYLLLSGSSLVAGICLSIWLMMHKKVSLLLLDRRQGQYIPRVFDKDATLIELEKARDKLDDRPEHHRSL